MAVSRAKSCTACRQVKLACDFRRRGGQACSRCAERGLECRFDAHFIRIPTRRLAQELTNKAHGIKIAKHHDKATAVVLPQSNATPPSTDVEGLLARTPDAVTYSQQGLALPQTVTWLDVRTDGQAQSYTLAGLAVPITTVVDLTFHFRQQYLQYAPFLRQTCRTADLASKSPLLFWTILLVSAERHPVHSGLYQDLATAHQSLLADVLISAILSIETIQSLLILILWPLPRDRYAEQPTWDYLNLALGAAQQTGISRTISPSEPTAGWIGLTASYADQLDPETRAMSWIACFEASVQISRFMGLLAPCTSPSMLRSVERSLQTVDTVITDTKRYTVRVLSILCAATELLEGVQDPGTHYSLIQSHDQALDNLPIAVTESHVSELELHSAKVYLYSLHLNLSLPKGGIESVQASAYRQQVLQKGLHSASLVVRAMIGLSTTSIDGNDRPNGQLTFSPEHYFTSLFHAASFLFRALATHISLLPQEVSLAISSLTDAHKTFQSFPDHREKTRAAIQIEHLVAILRDNSTHTTPFEPMVVTHYYGASVMYDAVFRTAQHRNINPETGCSPAPEAWVTLNVQYAQRLPQVRLNRKAASRSESASTAQHMQQDFDSHAWANWDIHMSNFELGAASWSTSDDALDHARIHEEHHSFGLDSQ